MGISIWQLGILLAIVLLLFGTKKLRNIGGDLGASIKSFKKEIRNSDDENNRIEKKVEDTSLKSS